MTIPWIWINGGRAMKKHLLIAAAVAALTALSCSKEAVDVEPAGLPEGEEVILTAGFGDDDATRTIRQADGKVYWSANDEIAVVRGTNVVGNKFVSTNTAPAPLAQFQGTMPSGTGAFWAVHPYVDGTYFDGTYLVTTLPDKQEAVADTFAEDLFISVAYSENETVTFYNVVGGLKFSVTQPGIKKVILSATGDEPLSGLMGIMMVSGRPTFWAWGTTQSQIELAPASGTFEVGKAYHFVTLPQELEKGFSLYFEKEDGTFAFRNVTKPVTIEASRFKTLMEADKGLKFENEFFEYSPSTISLSKFGGSFTVKVRSTVDFHFEVASDWIQEVSHKGDPLNEATYTFKASGNTGEAREGFIMVCNDSNCFFVTVNQEAGSADDWKTAQFEHHSLGMRFTATWCGYCPNMSDIFKMAKADLGDRFQFACFYSSSSGGLYGFSGINTLMSQFAVTGFPTGIVDGRRRIQNYNSVAYGSQVIADAIQETESNYPTATAIGLKSALSGQTVTVDVDVYSHIADNYKLTVLLLENNIVGYQRDFYVGDHNDFVHEHVVRKALTSVSGDAFTTTGTADKKSYSYSVSVPADYNTANLEILAYVQRPYGTQTVLQSGNYGSYYVDNCCSAPVGVTWAPDLR